MRTLTALASLVAVLCGCATLEEDKLLEELEEVFAGDHDPYLDKVSGPNVWVRVPKAGVLDLNQAIDVSQHWAVEHCERWGNDVGTYFVAADTAIMDKSEYSVTWRCCRPDDECCHNPKSCE